MTQKDKEILLQYLSAAFPYRVICEYDCVTSYDDVVIKRANSIGELRGIKPVFDGQIGFMINCDVVNALSDNIKPFLRPMSSMTEEESKEISILYGLKDILSIKTTDEYIEVVVDDGVCSTETRTIWYDEIISSIEIVDWLNSHHFDYRGLIGKGLAITVTKENNPYEN